MTDPFLTGSGCPFRKASGKSHPLMDEAFGWKKRSNF
jgi:hypothetical protein